MKWANTYLDPEAPEVPFALLVPFEPDVEFEPPEPVVVPEPDAAEEKDVVVGEPWPELDETTLDCCLWKSARWPRRGSAVTEARRESK